MTARAGRLLRRAAWFLAALVFTLAAASYSRLAESAQTGSTLREITVTPETAQTLSETEARAEQPAVFTLWHQADGQEVTDNGLGRSTTANVLLLKGDSALVLASGLNLPANDVSGCLIDRETAYALFGDESAGGILRYAERDYTVRGVFDAPRRTAILQGAPDTAYSMLTLEQGADADAFAARHSLSPGLIVAGNSDGEWAAFFAALPLWVAAWMLCLALWRGAARERLYPARRVLLLVASAGCACLFFWMLGDSLPLSAELVPTRWSDFEFWQRTFERWRTQAGSVFAMKKCAPDLLQLGFSLRAALWGGAGVVSLLRALRRQ